MGTRKVIVGLCETRWSERDKAYEHFYLALAFLVESFEIINGTHPNLLSNSMMISLKDGTVVRKEKQQLA